MPPAKPEVTGPVAGPIPIIHTGPLPDSPTRPTPPKVAFTDAAPMQEPAAIVPTPPPPRASTPAAPTPPPPRAPASGAPTPPPRTPPPAASAPSPHPRRSNRKPWLVVGVVSAFIVAGGVAAFLMLRPGGDIPEQTSTVDVTVPMNEVAVSTGVWCAAGDTLEITASGQAWHDATEESLVGPDGLTGGEVPEARVFADANTASLIGALDSTNEPFYVGYARTYVCPADGTLYLGINDTYLVGNHGSFQAQVTHKSAE
jgi:hypothetical protein